MPLNGVLRPVAQAVTSQRFFIYACLSTLAVVGVIANACRNYSNFYSVAIYLGRSGRSVVFLANFCCLLALLCGKVMQRLFFGPLQPREVERLYDQTWMFVTESLLAFTIFRDEFDIPFGIMFGFLLFIKCFHWLMSDRMESMDQIPYPGPSTWFHIRMNTLFAILWLVDFTAFSLAIDTTLNSGVGGMILFANEYAILMASALNSMAKYVINLIEFRHARANGGETAPPWEDKSMYVFYVELITDFLKLVIYLTFFAIIVICYGLPLNMIRDVYITARSFITRFRALSRYRTATRDMDQRYPNANEEEMAAMSDRTCIICRDEMVAVPAHDLNRPNERQAAPNITPKKLPCGHIFHFNCLRSWLERQQSCPTCRRSVLEPNTTARPGQPDGRQVLPQPGVQPNPFGFFGGARGPGIPVGHPFQQQQPQPQQGLLGRLLNAAVPPPPGQGGNAFPPGVNPGQHMGWGPFPQQPPHYGPFMYPYQPQPQQLQPPPPYPGFYGPGGAWQQWGMDPQLLGDIQQQQQQQQQQPSQSPGPSGASVSTPNSPSVPQDPPASPSVVASGPSPANTPPAVRSEGQRASTPRDAAVPAIPRRLNPSPGPSSTSTPPSSSVSGSGAVPSPSSDGIHTPASPLQTPTPTHTPVPPVEGVPSIPKLIPLTEFGAASPSPFFSPRMGHQVGAPRFGASVPTPVSHGYRIPSQNFPQQQSQMYTIPGQSPPQPQSRSLSPGLFRNLSTSNRPSPFTPASTSSPSPSSHRAPGQEQRPSLLSQLPNTLSDEQLLRMADRLTREAIDERLRLLSGVDDVVNRCIDELTKVRSVLPPVGDGVSLSASGSSAGVNGLNTEPAAVVTAAGSSEKTRGKEKEREPVLVDTVDSSTS